MSEYKVYERKIRGGIDKPLEDKKELPGVCSWVPGTPAKLFALRRPLEINPGCGFRVVNSGEEKAWNEAPKSYFSDGKKQSGGTGIEGLCLYSAGLIDLNKSCDERRDVEAASAREKVVDDPAREQTSFGFNDGRDSSIVEVDAMLKYSNFLSPGGSNAGLDEMEGQLAEIPFTQLLTSYNVVPLPSQESVISTTQQVVVDRKTVDTQIDRSTKESDLVMKDVDISIPGTFTEVLSSTVEAISDSQESANSTTHDVVDGVPGTSSPVVVFQVDSSTKEPDRRDVLLGPSQPKDTNITENLQKDKTNAEHMQAGSNSTESCVSQHGQQNMQEDVVSGMGVENLNKKSEKKRKTQQKPKKKKHRPKVVDEFVKPKKVPQPKTPKPVTPRRPSSKATVPSKKRKYVKKTSQGNAISEDIIHESLPKRQKSSRIASKNNSGVISEFAETSDGISELAAKSCRRALDFDLEKQTRDEKAITTATHQLELQIVDEALNTSKQYEVYFPSKCKKMRSKRRQRLNTLFMPNLISGREGIPRKRKRMMRRMIRKCNLDLLIAPPICNLLPRLPFNKAGTGEKEETEVICQPEATKKIIITNYHHTRKVMENRRKMELAYYDLEFHNNKREWSPLEDEIFLSTAKDKGSQRVIQEEKIDSAVQADPLESEDFGLTVKSTSSQEASQLQRKDSVNQKVPSEPNNLSLIVKTREELLQEERGNSYIQKSLPGSEDVWLIPRSRGSQEISEVEKTSSVTKKGLSKEINAITKKLKLLNLKGKGRRFKKQGPNSGHGTLVPYQELPIRNRKRILAKVDLDPYTLRMWNRLMNIEDSSNTEEEKIDAEKEAKWRKEREVFQGRIESFTARMHLILGDRRFRPWKGSVVDSVVGVYLTQNVSDNLSSSAYMTLSSKFPVQTTSNNTANNMASKGTAYNCEGNLYFVSEPEPDNRSCELKNGIEPMDSAIEGKYLVERDEGSEVESQTFEGSSPNVQSTDRIQLSPTFNPQADFASSSKTCSPGTCSCSNELPAFENTILPQDLHYSGGKISSCEEGQGDMYTTSRRMEYGNQATTSGRINELNGDCGFISLPGSYDHFEMTISPTNHMQLAHYGNQGLTSGRINESKVDHGFISHSDSHDHLDLSICFSNLEGSRSHMQQEQDATSMSKKILKGKGKKLKKDKAKSATPKKKVNQPKKDWELIRKMYCTGEQRSSDHMDSVDWDAVRLAEPSEIAETIKDRGQHNIIAGRIQNFLNRLVEQHNSIDLEWLRNAPPDIVKDYLLEIPGLGLKSVECVRLLSLQNIAFPVDTNVGRIAVRLGWVPLQPLPESLQIHLLDQYPLMDTIQKYLWPRLCNLDQRTLYELHYQLITFGKVFCTKRNPNCGVCPLRGECKHFASAFASARLALPGPSERRVVNIPNWVRRNPAVDVNPIQVTLLEAGPHSETGGQTNNCEPIIEEPASPQIQCTEMSTETDIEDLCTAPDEVDDIPVIRLQAREFKENIQDFLEKNKIVLNDCRALAVLAAEAASMPAPKLKTINRLRTEHLVYVLPDDHLLLQGFEKREPDDGCPYLLSIWTPGETPNSFQKPVKRCNSGESELCNEQTCYSCNTIRELSADIVRGTILIPCRTANRGRFPLNGTYFQVNEVFADDETSHKPISVPRSMIAHLQTQTAYFGSSASSIFRALDLPEIQRCFWRGYICVRGFDRTNGAPRPLATRFHISPSKMGKKNDKWHDE